MNKRFSTSIEKNKTSETPVQNNWLTVFSNPTILIDFEGVVVEPKNEKIKDYHDLEYVDINILGIKTLRMKGYGVSILAGYPEISNGNTNIDKINQLHEKVMIYFGQMGIYSIDNLLFSISNFKEDEFALPNIGMIKRLKNEFKVSLEKGFMIGDNYKAMKAAEKAELIPILIKSARYDETIKKLDTFANKKLFNKIKTYNNLQDFADSL